MDLHTATDQLNRVLGDFEDTLRGLNLGVSARVPIDGGSCELAFEKRESAFQLLVVTPNETTPLLNSSREMRLRAVEHLMPLHGALLEAYQLELDRVYRATAMVVGLTTRISQERP